MTDYSNILKAISNKSVLTPEQQADNYNAFSKMMSEGVYLPDIVKRLDELEAKIKTLESTPRSETDPGVFAVMETTVRDDARVKQAKRKASDAKSEIISEICLKDDRYRTALEEYKAIVNKVYVEMKEKSPK